MLVTFNFDTQEKHTEISASPCPYESPPLSPVIIYGTPLLCNPDRLYVLAALLFQHSLSGPFLVDNIAPCSRHVALAIENFFAPLSVFVENQTIEPRGNAIGLYKGFVQCSPQREVFSPSFSEAAGDTIIRFVPEGVGALFSEHEMVIGTNLFMDTTSPQALRSSMCAYIGAAMLYCEDWQINTLCIRHTPAIQGVKALLASVSLDIDWC